MIVPSMNLRSQCEELISIMPSGQPHLYLSEVVELSKQKWLQFPGLLSQGFCTKSIKQKCKIKYAQLVAQQSVLNLVLSENHLITEVVFSLSIKPLIIGIKLI